MYSASALGSYRGLKSGNTPAYRVAAYAGRDASARMWSEPRFQRIDVDDFVSRLFCQLAAKRSFDSNDLHLALDRKPWCVKRLSS